MTIEEKKALVQGLFQGADLSGVRQIIAINEGDVCYQKCSTDSPVTTKSEKDVKNAVVRLMEEKDSEGKFLMRDQDQFYAVKAVLTAFLGFPPKPADFGKVMHNLELDNLRVRYDNESIRKVHVHQLPQNVALWHQYQNTADQYSLKQVTVAVKLMELLEIDGH